MNSKTADHKHKQEAAEDYNTNPDDAATSTTTAPSTTTELSIAILASTTAAKSTLSEPSPRKPRKRAKVSFSQEVISKDNSGDGSKVVIKEEHGVFLGPLLGRMVVSSSDQIDGEEDADTSKAASSAPVISFANDSHTNEKLLSYSESSHGILKSSNKKSQQPLGGNGNSVEYDNLVVRMGLLKCGHRYRVVVPIPDYWKQKDAQTKTSNKDDAEQVVQIMQSHESYAMHVRIVEDSLDGDLRGEIQTEYADSDASSSSATTLRQHHVCITLSARRRGPYRGRFVLEFTRRHGRLESQSTSHSKFLQQTESIPNTESKSNLATSPEASSNTPDAHPSPHKCLMSLQVDATIMGKDMGTPKLRNGVVCSGKMVGYDSDEETEWQGFD
mmetsp:Transcript_11446/g.21174  ORF Transcript_11446/g.21174 Transcript_11446/m.21174 type:complete len:386 (-) Transcript_11446:32-1189(-)